MSQDSLGLTGLLDISNEQLLFEVQPLMNYVNNDQFMGHELDPNDINLKTELVDNIDQRMPASAIPDVLTNEEYPGPLNFEVNLDPCGAKNPWVYSPMLNKIYIGANTPFPVDFKCNNMEDRILYVRATPIFSLPQYSQELVVRCAAHCQKTDNSNIGQPEYLRHHVIRCQNSKAYYFGDKDKGIRLNVVVQLSKPQPGTDSVREMYQFMCKNSCPSGMNRKPIEVIFTLEDESSAVLGRRVLCVRICSCPKRDKEKEEKEVVNKDKESTPHGKKRKMNDHKKASANVETPVDTKELVVNHLPVIGKQNYIKVLEFTANLMAGESLKHGPVAGQSFKKCYNHINGLINQNNQSM